MEDKIKLDLRQVENGVVQVKKGKLSATILGRKGTGKLYFKLADFEDKYRAFNKFKGELNDVYALSAMAISQELCKHASSDRDYLRKSIALMQAVMLTVRKKENLFGGYESYLDKDARKTIVPYIHEIDEMTSKSEMPEFVKDRVYEKLAKLKELVKNSKVLENNNRYSTFIKPNEV